MLSTQLANIKKKKKIHSFGNAASSHSGLIPLNTLLFQLFQMSSLAKTRGCEAAANKAVRDCSRGRKKLESM